MAGPKGIKWSAPVLIRKDGAGLIVTVPAQVCGALDAGAGDVLNFTQLPDGAIEVWRVKKTSYASLEAMAGKSPKPSSPLKKKAGPASARAGGKNK